MKRLTNLAAIGASALVLVGCLTMAGCSEKGPVEQPPAGSLLDDPDVQFTPVPTQPGQDPGGEAAHAARDVEVFKQLKKLGADLSKPRDARFFLYFTTAQQVQEAKSAIMQSSMKAEKNLKFEQSTNMDGEPMLIVSADMVVDEKRLAGLRKELISIAEKHGGEFDGWECAGVP